MPALTNTGTTVLTASASGNLNNTAPVSGQLMVISGQCSTTGVTCSAPTGFTQIPVTPPTSGTTTSQNAWYKVCDGTEGANIAVATSASGTSRWVSATYSPDGGYTWTTPLDQKNTSTSGGVAVVTLATGSITPTKANFLLIAIAGASTASANTFAAWTNSLVQEAVIGQQSISLADLQVGSGSGAYSSTASWTAGKTGLATTIIANFFQTSTGVTQPSSTMLLMSVG